jgi:hypothetical protein
MIFLFACVYDNVWEEGLKKMKPHTLSDRKIDCKQMPIIFFSLCPIFFIAIISFYGEIMKWHFSGLVKRLTLLMGFHILFYFFIFRNGSKKELEFYC